MKAEHLKKAADQALKAGNLRAAYTKCVWLWLVRPSAHSHLT
jgi:hypothetical protein